MERTYHSGKSVWIYAEGYQAESAWDFNIVDMALNGRAMLLKHGLKMTPGAVNLICMGCRLAELPILNPALSTEKAKATLEVILRAMGPEKAAQNEYDHKVEGVLPYSKGKVFGTWIESFGNNLLHIITYYQQPCFIDVLEKAGVHIEKMMETKNSDGETPVDIALNLNDLKMAFKMQQAVTNQKVSLLEQKLMQKICSAKNNPKKDNGRERQD